MRTGVLAVLMFAATNLTADAASPRHDTITVPVAEWDQLHRENAKLLELVRRATNVLEYCATKIDTLANELEQKKKEVCM